MGTAHRIVPAWTRIVHWLKSNAPATALALGPPATDTAVRRLEEALGFPVPEELEAWLRLNDGTSAAPGTTLFPVAEVFLGCDAIAARFLTNLRVAGEIDDADWWRPHWIPLTMSDGHYGLLLDAATGAVLGYTESDYPHPHAASPDAWLTAVADTLESGVAGLPTRGFAPVVHGRWLVWK
ncbi:SMI1/KNR4 family protein [Streptomyces sp. NPDC056144]|uniref:SMI1/KNR4 family protein n=1 Tax=unclassified Streptomyces TaxID=2593676 RepID=UPI0035D84A5B